jgi:hypothetical protein
MAMTLLRRPAYCGFYQAVTMHLHRESQNAVRMISTTQQTRASDAATVNSTFANRITEAGMSSLIAPLRHSNKAFESHALQEILSGIGLEDAADSRSDLRTSKARLPGLASIAKRIRRGQILVPMSRFLDVAMPQILTDANATSSSIDRLSIDAMLHVLSTTAIHADRKLSTIVQRVNRQRIWKPAQLPSGAITTRMPVKHLCVYALATVYDVANQLHIVPSQGSLAATIRALAACDIDLQTFSQCSTLVLLQLSGVPFHQAQLQAAEESMHFRNFDARKIGAVVIAAAIDGFGLLGRPEIGESLLSWWSKARKPAEARSVLVSLPANGSVIDAACWLDNQTIWKALLRARIKTHDLVSARHWLQEYRRVVPLSKKSSTPYLDYAKACMASDNLNCVQFERTDGHHEGERRIKLLVLRETLNMLKSDGVAYNEALFSLYVNTLVGHGKLSEAASIIHRALISDLAPQRSAGLSKAIFRLHRMHMIRSPDTQSVFARVIREHGVLSEEAIRKHGPYHDPRLFIIDATPRIQQAAMNDRVKSSPALEDALQCAVVYGDLPLALYVLDHMQTGSLMLGYKTVDMVDRWLPGCQNGQTPVRHKKQHPSYLKSLQTKAVSALRESRLRLPKTLSGASYADAEDDPGFTQLRRHICHTLVRAVDECLSYDAALRADCCSDWMLSLLRKIDVEATGQVTDEDIVRHAMNQLLEGS